ncbi:MAG: hypothetical protein AAGE94_04875 [Acidobacteriota bacterium]
METTDLFEELTVTELEDRLELSCRCMCRCPQDDAIDPTDD